MSDTGTTTPEPTTTEAPTPAPASSSPPAASDDVFANPLGSDEPFVSRGFAENLRAEGLKYRTDLRSTQQALNAYEVVFGDYQPADRDVWFDLANTWKQDPVR